MEARVSAVLAEVLPPGTDEYTLDYLVGVLVEDADLGAAEVAASVGPFLVDAGAAETDEECEALCASILRRVLGGGDAGSEAAAAAGGGGQTGGGRAEVEEAAAVPAAPAARSVPLPAAPAAKAAMGAAPISAAASSSAKLAQPTVGEVARGPRPRDEGTILKVLRDVLGGGLEDDIADYVAGVLAEDVDEEDAAFEDAVGPFLVDAGAASTEEEVAVLCGALRAGLCEAAGPAPKEEPAAGQPMKRLAAPMRLGGGADESGAPAVTLESGMSLYERELARREKEEEQRRAELHQANLNRAQGVQAKKREEERERARKGRARAEAAAEELMGVDAAPMKAAKDTAKHIYVPKFELPAPRGGEPLLSEAALRLMPGQRYGLCGRNGAGKSTLLRLVAQRRITGLPSGLRILYVAQDSADRIGRGAASAVDAVLQSDGERSSIQELIARLEKGGDPKGELAPLYERWEAMGGAAGPAEARNLLRGLQFTPQMAEAPVSSLSGGWRMRVALAQALYQLPDVLLLDEPTNHLDLEAVLWLENRLQDWGDRTLVVVSHDRTFLDQVCTDVIHLHRRKLEYYAGDFSTFEAVRVERRLRQQRLHEQQAAKKAEMQKYVDKHLHKGSSLVRDDAGAKQAKSRAKKMERIGGLGQDGKKYKLSYDGPQTDVEAVEVDSQFRFRFPDPDPGGARDMVQFNEVGFAYPGTNKMLFRGLSFGIDAKARICLVGFNGTGKSTLVKLILGKLQPTKGSVVCSKNFRVACFTQHHMDQLDLDLSPLEYVLEHARQRDPDATPEEVRKRVGHFGISGHLQTQRMGLLSGGEKSRVAFCLATWDRPHLLLLDEPTNHLDIETVDALIDAVRSFEGGIVMVSHDQHFISSSEELWVVGGGAEGGTGIERREGGFHEYKREIQKKFSVQLQAW